ncbi:unnamed protein product [Agarophyton chilense]
MLFPYAGDGIASQWRVTLCTAARSKLTPYQAREERNFQQFCLRRRKMLGCVLRTKRCFRTNMQSGHR